MPTLITGANRGIGLSLARAFAQTGETLFATARHPNGPALAHAAREFPNLHPLALDVTDDHSARIALAEVSARTHALDVLINNAAIFPGDGTERLENLDLNWFAEAVEVNVAGVARVTRTFLPLLRAGSQPRIINISSGAGSISTKEDFDDYPYAVSKAGLNMLTRAMAAEFAPEDIIVTALSPGWVRTEMGGPNAPLTPEESARSLHATITRLTPADTGRFYGRDGASADYAW